MPAYWTLYAFAALFASLSAVRSVRKFVGGSKWGSRPVRGTSSRLPPRPPKGQGKLLLISQVPLVILILTEFGLGDWSLADVGVKDSLPLPYVVCAGAVVYYLFAIGVNLAASLFGYQEHLQDVGFLAMRSIWPRDPLEKKMAAIGVCALNPVTEEVLYRGVLVFALGNYLGGFALPIVLGFALFLAVHIYQGPRALFGHVLVYVMLVSLLFSNWGLGGAVGFHFAADIFPVFTFKDQMSKWRVRQSERSGR